MLLLLALLPSSSMKPHAQAADATMPIQAAAPVVYGPDAATMAAEASAANGTAAAAKCEYIRLIQWALIDTK